MKIQYYICALLAWSHFSYADVNCGSDLHQVGDAVVSHYLSEKDGVVIEVDGVSYVAPRLGSEIYQVLNHDFGATIFWDDMSSVSISTYEDELRFDNLSSDKLCWTLEDIDSYVRGVVSPYKLETNVLVLRKRDNIFIVGHSKRLKKYLVSIYELGNASRVVTSLNFDHFRAQ